MATLDAPFGRGKTYYGGRTIDVSSSYANVGGQHLEGQIHYFDDTNVNDTAYGIGAAQRTGRKIKCICVRNVSGGVLYPRRLVQWGTAANYGKRIAGHSAVDAGDVAGVVDDKIGTFSPSYPAGVPDGDLFWLVVEGLVLVDAPLTGAAYPNSIALGDYLYAATAAASIGGTASATTGGTTAGRLRRMPASFSAQDTTDANTASAAWKYTLNAFGRAVSAAASGATATTPYLLCHVKTYWTE